MTDAERALADDPEGFARLRAVLHGAAGPAPGRRLPTLEERFGAATAPKPAAPRRPDAPTGRRKAACPGHGTR
jgi:hypothetical protein